MVLLRLALLSLLLPLITQGQEQPADICGALRAGAADETVPPSIKDAGEGVRVVALGDFGDGSARQRRVAAAMLAYHRTRPFDFGITLGDNFYPERNRIGLIRRRLDSHVHPWWETRWEALYAPLRIRFYAALGNHDYWDSSPAILMRRESSSWCLPRAFYTYRAGPAQLFALDTTEDNLTDEQLDWLVRELKASRARWKIVYGHHPVKSDGEHGPDAYVRALREKILLPRLKDGGLVDLYIAGHEHDLEYLRPEGSLQLFIAGGGGRPPRHLRRKQNRVWGRSANGFAVIEADEDELMVKFVDVEGRELCAVTLRKGKDAELENCQEP